MNDWLILCRVLSELPALARPPISVGARSAQPTMQRDRTGLENMASNDWTPAEAALAHKLESAHQTQRPMPVFSVLESVRRARAHADVAAAMVRKLRGSPLAWLAARGGIRGEEMRAVDDVALAFLEGLPMIPPRTGGSSAGVSGDAAEAQRRYRNFAGYWSHRAKFGDPTLSILIAIVVDHQPFESVEQETCVPPGKAAVAVLAGLRDYAARAGWVDDRLAQQWIAEATAVFAREADG